MTDNYRPVGPNSPPIGPQSMSAEAFVEREMKLDQLRTDPSLNDPLLTRPVD